MGADPALAQAVATGPVDAELVDPALLDRVSFAPGPDPASAERAGADSASIPAARRASGSSAALPDPRAVAATVADPELPVLTLADLGVLRQVERTGERGVLVTITPTYTGCPAMEVIRTDLRAALRRAGYAEVEVRTVLSPAWSTDWITPDGRRKLAAAGIAPPGAAPRRAAGPVPLTLGPVVRRVACPQCGAADTDETSAFGPTPCTALRRCRSCGEPFQHVKEI